MYRHRKSPSPTSGEGARRSMERASLSSAMPSASEGHPLATGRPFLSGRHRRLTFPPIRPVRTERKTPVVRVGGLVPLCSEQGDYSRKPHQTHPMRPPITRGLLGRFDHRITKKRPVRRIRRGAAYPRWKRRRRRSSAFAPFYAKSAPTDASAGALRRPHVESACGCHASIIHKTRCSHPCVHERNSVPSMHPRLHAFTAQS